MKWGRGVLDGGEETRRGRPSGFAPLGKFPSYATDLRSHSLQKVTVGTRTNSHTYASRD